MLSQPVPLDSSLVCSANARWPSRRQTDRRRLEASLHRCRCQGQRGLGGLGTGQTLNRLLSRLKTCRMATHLRYTREEPRWSTESLSRHTGAPGPRPEGSPPGDAAPHRFPSTRSGFGPVGSAGGRRPRTLHDHGRGAAAPVAPAGQGLPSEPPESMPQAVSAAATTPDGGWTAHRYRRPPPLEPTAADEIDQHGRWATRTLVADVVVALFRLHRAQPRTGPDP